MTLAKLYPLNKCSPKYTLKVILIIIPISAVTLNFFQQSRCSTCCLKVNDYVSLKFTASQF